MCMHIYATSLTAIIVIFHIIKWALYKFFLISAENTYVRKNIVFNLAKNCNHLIIDGYQSSLCEWHDD